MNAHAPILADTANAPDDWAQSLLRRQLEMLGELAETGLEITRAIKRQVTSTDAAPVAPGDPALAYTRVARAVRLTLALQSKVIADLQALEAGKAQAVADREQKRADDRFELEETRKARIERIALRIITAEADDEDAVDRLIIEAGERLDDEDLYGDIMTRPFSESLAHICRDLGLHPDWASLAQEPWARAEIESGEVGTPLLELGAARGAIKSRHQEHQAHQEEPEPLVNFLGDLGVLGGSALRTPAASVSDLNSTVRHTGRCEPRSQPPDGAGA